MKNHFDVSGSIEIREVDIAGVACSKIHRSFSVNVLPGPVAWSDACPPGMRTVTGMIIGSGNILSFPSTDSSRAVVNYWRKNVHLILVNCLGILPRNSVVRLTDHLVMTIVDDWDVKPQIKPKKLFYVF